MSSRALTSYFGEGYLNKLRANLCEQESPPIGGAVRNASHSSHSDCVYSTCYRLFRKTFMHDRASTRMGELTSTTTRLQPVMCDLVHAIKTTWPFTSNNLPMLPAIQWKLDQHAFFWLRHFQEASSRATLIRPF